jgi:hypothetical protein
LHAKATHGNANDLNHATMALDTELFVTADVSFFKALSSAAPHFHVSKLAKVVAWPRALTVREALDAVVEMSTSSNIVGADARH